MSQPIGRNVMEARCVFSSPILLKTWLLLSFPSAFLLRHLPLEPLRDLQKLHYHATRTELVAPLSGRWHTALLLKGDLQRWYQS